MKHDTSISKNFNVLGIDVGGTFTDLIYVDKENNIIEFAKVPTSPENQAFGVMNAIKKAKLKLDKVKLIVHGTTTTTNALLERKLSKTGLITTSGFKDVLELGRRTRPNSYGMYGTLVESMEFVCNAWNSKGNAWKASYGMHGFLVECMDLL